MLSGMEVMGLQHSWPINNTQAALTEALVLSRFSRDNEPQKKSSALLLLKPSESFLMHLAKAQKRIRDTEKANYFQTFAS